jgi:hypothetical protein
MRRVRITAADCRVPKWEEYPHTPGVCVRVRNKGDKPGQHTGMVVRPQRTIAIGGGVRRTAWRASMGGRVPSSAEATAGRNLADLTKPL